MDEQGEINSKIGQLCTRARLLGIQMPSESLVGKMAAMMLVCGCREAHPSALTLNNVAKHIKQQLKMKWLDTLTHMAMCRTTQRHQSNCP